MSCCGVTIEAHRNADLRKTYAPRGRNYTFAGFSPLMQIRDGTTVLLTVSLSATANGSVFSVISDALALTLKKADVLALASGPGDRLLSYDIVLSQGGIESWFVGGDFVVLDINATTTEGEQNVTVDIDGQTVDVNIMGGNIGIGASVLLADLNSAVESAEQSADDAAASLAAVPGLATTAGAAAGTTAGTAAGAAAGTTAGTTAANAVVATKANTDLGNVTALTGRNSLSAAARDGSDVSATAFRTAIGADQSANVQFIQSTTSAQARSVLDKLRTDLRSILDFVVPGVGGNATTNTAALNAALANGWLISLYGAEGLRIKINGTLNVPIRAGFVGPESGGVVWEPQAGTYPLFNIQGSYCTLYGFSIDNALKTGGPDIKFTVTGDMIEFRCFHIQTSGSYQFLDDTGVTGKYFRTYFDYIICDALKGPLVNFTRAFAYNYWGVHVTANYNGSTAPNQTAVSGTGGSLGTAEGGLFIGIQVTGTAGVGATNATQIPFSFTTMPELHMLGTRADSCGGKSTFNGCTNLKFDKAYFGLCNDGQVDFVNCTYVEGNMHLRGRNTIVSPAPAANKSNVTFGANNAIFDLSIFSIEATGHGIEQTAASATEININGTRSRSNTLRGLKTSTGGVLNFVGFQLNANGAGNYDFGGALHQVVASQNNAGNFLQVSGVGTG